MSISKRRASSCLARSIHEAALRQIVVLASKTSNRERFSRAAISYLSRFRRSAYVAGFETQLAFHIVRFDGRDGLLILQELLNAYSQGWGRCLACFLASISEQAILSGKVDLASTAAQAALPFAANDAEKQRLLLYNGAALIVTKDFITAARQFPSRQHKIQKQLTK